MKLKALLACDRVLFDGGTSPSIISIFHDFKIDIPTPDSFPQNAVIPRDWAVFSIWDISPEEEGKTKYTQVIEVYWPDATAFGRFALVTEEAAKERLIYTGKLMGFPAGQAGNILLRVWIEHNGQRISDIEEASIKVSIGILEDEALTR